MSNYQIDHPALYPSNLPAEAVAEPDVYMTLKPAEKAFVDAYLSTMGESAKAAGIALADQIHKAHRHGYDIPVSGRAKAMLASPSVQAAISQRARQISTKFEVSRDRILKDVAAIAFSNMGNYLHITADGDPYIDLSSCTVEQMAAISEITVEDFKEGRGEDSRDVRRVKLKLHNKLDGLDKLMKFFDMFAPERHEHVHTVKAAVVTAQMTPEQLADIWSQRMKGGA